MSAILLRAKRTSCEIHHFFETLVFSEETTTKFNHINPITFPPNCISFAGALYSKVEIKSVDVECDSLHNFIFIG